MESRHSPASVRFECSFCSHKAKRVDHLKFHIETFHDDVKREYKCQDCEKVYNSKSSLGLHHNTVHRKMRYKCDICDYEATQKSHLNSHKKSIHEGIKYQCNECEKEFSQRSHLKSHCMYVHQ